MIGIRLAFADLRHEWLLTLCQILALAAVLTPLLVCYGLKTGLIESMFSRLRSDPDNLQLRLVGDLGLDPATVDRLRALPGVGFVLPMPRALSLRLYLRPAAGTVGLTGADLLPTAAGDPLRGVESTDLDDGRIVLSATLANRMGMQLGDRLSGESVREDTVQRLRFEFVVAAILPPGRLDGQRALVTPAVADRVEAFLDGYAIPDHGITVGRPLSERTQRSAQIRLYAGDLDALDGLVGTLQRAPFLFDVRSEVEQVRDIRQLKANFDFVFSLLALIGAGYLVALAATLWANVVRKQRALSTIRLFGAASTTLLVFPLVQAVMLSAGGTALSLLLYESVAAIINTRFPAEAGVAGETVCRLGSDQLAIVVGLITLAAILSSLAGGWRAARLDPTEGLRDV